MVSPLSLLLILATATASTSGGRDTDAVEIYHCDFDQQFGHPCDVNYDDWPDHWKRATGPGFPHYLQIGLANDETATAGRCLTIHANGGNAQVESPTISVSKKFGYVLQAKLRVDGLKHSRARITLEFCDENRDVLHIDHSDWYAATSGWQEIEIGPVKLSDPEVRLVRLRFTLEAGARIDLSGTASLDDIWLARLPKLTVKTNSPYNIYTDQNDVVVTCELSGVQQSDPDILFELLDASSQQLSDDWVQLQGRLITERLSKASDFFAGETGRPAGYMGSESWKPPIAEPGFYRVRVTMKTARGTLDRRLVNLAVVPPLDRPANGDFGWSLTGGNIPLNFEELGRLLPAAAVNWVKVPIWYSLSDPHHGDRLIVFTEKLAAQDIEVVGVVDRPPADSDLARQLPRGSYIADALGRDPSEWMPLLDPILTRLSLRIRWWQLGDDFDASYGGYPNLEHEITRIRESLFRFGQEVRLGIGWNWLLDWSSKTAATWDFQQFTAQPALTGAELGSYLQLSSRDEVARWVAIEPLPADVYDLETRARDLVDQMLAAKIYGADAAFATRPFDRRYGLMTPEGTPSELLLPWRTTSALLSGAEYLGRIQLPQGSENRIFLTPQGDVLMVVWSDRPTRETVHLGDEIRVVDVWGRERQPSKEGRRDVIDVEVMPTFIRGLNPSIARWRIGARFVDRHIPSVFGKAHTISLEFRNEFPQGTGGTVSVYGPEGWQVGPQDLEFKLSPSAVAQKRFAVTLPLDANSGVAPIRADFVVSADQRYEFSVYRDLTVGDGEVEMNAHSHMGADGSLIVEQRMINHGEKPADFKCLLYAKGRRRQRTQVFRLGPNEDLKTYRLKNGEELLDSTLWLRIEEINGTRVLNHRFSAER